MRPGDELPDDCKLYVGNLSPAVTDAVLKQLMEPFGNVLHAVVLLDMSTGQSRGFGFVHMDCAKAAADVRPSPAPPSRAALPLGALAGARRARGALRRGALQGCVRCQPRPRMRWLRALASVGALAPRAPHAARPETGRQAHLADAGPRQMRSTPAVAVLAAPL
jgi:hypothetical protein